MDIHQNHSDSPNRADESSTLINNKAQPDNSNNGPSPDQLFLSPIEKFAIYNKFPFNLIVHFLLVVGTTYQLMIINTTYPRSQERALYQMFIEENDKTNFEYKRTKYLYSLDDVKKLLNDSIYNYYGIKDSSFETVKFYNDNLPPSPFISANYYKSKNGGGVVLGCTEFPVIYSKFKDEIDSLGVEIYDPIDEVFEFLRNEFLKL